MKVTLDAGRPSARAHGTASTSSLAAAIFRLVGKWGLRSALAMSSAHMHRMSRSRIGVRVRESSVSVLTGA